MVSKVVDILKLSELLLDSTFSIYKRVWNSENKNYDLVLYPKGKNLFLSWYGNTAYLFSNKKEYYLYTLTDQNEYKMNYGIGEYTKEKIIPKSFPVLIQYFGVKKFFNLL